MQNKTRLELADYEAENLAKLQKMFSRKWEFIFMQVKLTYERKNSSSKVLSLRVGPRTYSVRNVLEIKTNVLLILNILFDLKRS